MKAIALPTHWYLPFNKVLFLYYDVKKKVEKIREKRISTLQPPTLVAKSSTLWGHELLTINIHHSKVSSFIFITLSQGDLKEAFERKLKFNFISVLG